MRRAFITVIPYLMVAAACGGRSPVEPSGNGATISGQIVSPGQSGGTRGVRAASPNPSAHGITVTVAGTDISVPVSGSAFDLTGVPSGPLSLRFTGNGMDSELGLAPIEGTEDIDLTVSVNGATVTLESERRSFGKETQLEGLVESLPGVPANSLMVAGQLVTTSDQTRYFYQGVAATFADIAVGFRVHVKGQPGTEPAGSLAAVTIMIQSKNVGEEEEEELDEEQDESASIEGLLATLGGGAFPDLLVGNTTVHTDASTRVQRKGDTQDLSVLVLGMRLHVVGTRQPDSSILARKIQIKGDAVGAAFEIEGSMGGLKGTCPTLSFSVNGYKVTTDAGTTFTPECSTFKSGTKATVNGVMQADGSIKATSVTK